MNARSKVRSDGHSCCAEPGRAYLYIDFGEQRPHQLTIWFKTIPSVGNQSVTNWDVMDRCGCTVRDFEPLRDTNIFKASFDRYSAALE